MANFLVLYVQNSLFSVTLFISCYRPRPTKEFQMNFHLVLVVFVTTAAICVVDVESRVVSGVIDTTSVSLSKYFQAFVA